MRTPVMLTLAALLLAGCSAHAPQPREPSSGHLRPAPEAPGTPADIPAPVVRSPILPEPEASARLETYTVVVSQVPVKELLFALARDARLNVDVSQGISGNVTLNAVDQTLPQILERLSRQLDLRYTIEENLLVVEPDIPYFKTYKVDYLNVTMGSSSTTSVDMAISGEGETDGGSKSTTTISSETKNEFWETVVSNVLSILGIEATGQFYKLQRTVSTTQGSGDAGITERAKMDARQENFLAFSSKEVIANPHAGVISVLATEGQHRIIQEYLDRVSVSIRRQVLIEATIVEVQLNDEYAAGVDWAKIAANQGLTILSGTAAAASGAGALPLITSSAVALGSAANAAPSFIIDYQDKDNRGDGLSLTVSLLDEFGNTRVLSSPKLMALNNQTAVLKVVDEIVYFEVKTEVAKGTANQSDTAVTTTTAKTVPVGIVMRVTPQISSDGSVTLSIKPTITRVTRFIADPNPDLGAIQNLIPQIQTREMESILRVNSGQVAVLGGLMQDTDSRATSTVPGLSSIGEAFTSRDNKVEKSELVVFLRPTVVNQPSIDNDLKEFRPFLEQAARRTSPAERGGAQP